MNVMALVWFPYNVCVCVWMCVHAHMHVSEWVCMHMLVHGFACTCVCIIQVLYTHFGISVVAVDAMYNNT